MKVERKELSQKLKDQLVKSQKKHFLKKTKHFLRKLKSSGNWNRNHDYSMVTYIDPNTKILIIDKKLNIVYSISPKHLIGKTKVTYNNVLNYDDVKNFVSKLKIKSKKEWESYCKSDNKPMNIPENPHTVYENRGWISWGNFLDSDVVETKHRVYLSYNDAKSFIKNLNLKTQEEWRVYSKSDNRPNNIPAGPHIIYKNNGWISWSDFLGYGNNSRVKNIKSREKRVEYTKSVNNIPTEPNKCYGKTDSTSQVDSSQTNTKSKKSLNRFLSYEDAKEFVQKINVKSSNWGEYSKNYRPNNIPSNPNIFYKDCGWISWWDFLGKGGEKFLSYDDAKEFIQKININTKEKWDRYCKSDYWTRNIPSNPHHFYKDKGWISWSDFLRNGEREDRYLTFKEVKKFVRKLKIKSWYEWHKYCKNDDKPQNIPSSPNVIYKDAGWISWGDFLGTDNVCAKKKFFLPFEEAKKFVQKLNINSYGWREYSKNHRPKNIPANPHMYYKNSGWISFNDFLGNNVIAPKNKVFVPFSEAKEFVQKLNIKSVKEWNEYLKSGNKPNNIPSCPHVIYKNSGWISHVDFLGYNRKIK
jgi:hypothetical protein